ncbi:MAG: hypothetical protein GF401_12585 [Chitinivibrionales bacterium]|nr:hypothetical protein [Chitinivibrionales bacterium]
MLRRATEFFGIIVQCSDGDVGTVKDLYFDEEEWNMRYIAIQIEEPIEARTALVAITALGSFDWDNRILKLPLTREKVYNSPETDVDLPISREYEMALHRYYEWPVYWGQSSFMDTPRVKKMDETGIPYEDGTRGVDEEREAPDAYNYDEGDYGAAQTLASGEPEDEEMRELEFAEPSEERSYSASIHSAGRIREYTILTTDEQGAACNDVLIDDSDWSVRYLIAKPPQKVKEKYILLPVGHISDFRSATSEIELTLSNDDLQKSPAYDEKEGTDVYERKLYAFYDERGLT